MLNDLLRIALELHPPSLRMQLLGSTANVRPQSMLRPYQVYIADKIVELPAVLMAVEMSLGKTGSTLTAVRRLLDNGTIKRVLIVAPLEVARNTWPDEIAVWEHTRDLDFTVLIGDPVKRETKVRDDSRIHIINRELITWLVAFWGETWPYDCVVWDESSRFKAGKKRSAGSKKPDPKTGKKRPPKLSEFGAICSIRKFVKRIVLLTGTPAPNGIHDLWGQAYVLDFGHRLGATMRAFENRWFDKDYMGWNMEPKPHAEAEIMGLLKDVMIGLRAEDYIALPPKVMSKVYVDLTPAQMKEYKRFERTLVSEVYDVEAVSKGVLTNKILQYANGSMYRPIEGTYPVEREVVHVHDAKIEALERIIEESAGQNILVAYSFKFDLDRIKKRFPKAVVFDDDPDFVKNWNDGKIQLGLAHPASIGHGLNLQHGGHIQVWYGLTWSLELYQQFNQRLARPGQKNPNVFIYHILARGTVDESVYRVMNTKDATQNQITQAVRVRVLNGD